MAAEISHGPISPGTEANISRGTKCTVANFHLGTLWLDQSEAQEFWGLLIGQGKGTSADFGRGTICTAADISLGTWVLRPTRCFYIFLLLLLLIRFFNLDL